MSMIARSFILLDHVGPAGERNIWDQGVRSWNEFISASKLRGLNPLRKRFYDKQLVEARGALQDYRAEHFTGLLGSQHAWRLWNHFKQDTVFLDIETTGGYGNITVIGLYDGVDTKIMVRGFNLNKDILKRELEKYSLIVTFNGACFDLPVIHRYFGDDVVPAVPHIDLRGVCGQIGLKGGLKKIEKDIGIMRPDDIQYVYGDDAAFLWHKWEASGDRKYLDILIRYNEEDIMNLKPLAEHAISKLWERTFVDFRKLY